MTTATLTTNHLARASSNGASPDKRTTVSIPVPEQDVDKLVVRLAAADERESISALATRCGSPRPHGAVMVGEVEGRLLAAVALGSREALSEPTPSGEAAAAVVRHRVAELSRRRRAPRAVRAAAA